MRILTSLAPAVVAFAWLGFCAVDSLSAAEKAPRMLAHDVFFTLKDRTPEGREKLAAACQEYLTDHPGTEFFAVGVVAEEFDRPLNDRDYDVALHIYFKDKAAHDTYQTSARHTKFVDENKDLWTKVRVFDSWCDGPKKAKTAEKASAKSK